MFTPFILFFGLTVATAVIAYWSDNLGKKLGKKRVSLWGLRPRTTATLLTVASSWGIMLSTIVVLLIVAEPLRSALFRFDRERARNKDLLESRQQLEVQNKKLGGEQAKLQQNNAALERQNELATKKLKLAQERAKKATESAKSATEKARVAVDARSQAERARNRALRAEKRALVDEERAQRGKSVAERQAKLAQNNLTSVQAQLIGTQTQLGSTQKRLTSATRRLNGAQERLDQAQKRLKAVQVRLKEAGAKTIDAYKQVADAYRQVADAYAQVDETKKQVQAINAERERLQAATKVLEAQYERLYGVAAALDQQFQLATGSNVLISIGQNLAERVLDADENSTQIESNLRELLREGQFEVARRKENATLTLSSLVVGNGPNEIVLPPEKVIASVVDYIGQKMGNVSVRLVADRNFSVSEKEVTARFVVVDVRPALEQGVVLYELAIDGHQSDAKVFSQLLDLVEKARARVSNVINPPISPAQPFFAQGTNELLFEALRQIRQIDGPTRVRIVSAAPLTTVDSPQVRFEVQPSKP